jgi:hypothetical protein
MTRRNRRNQPEACRLGFRLFRQDGGPVWQTGVNHPFVDGQDRLRFACLAIAFPQTVHDIKGLRQGCRNELLGCGPTEDAFQPPQVSGGALVLGAILLGVFPERRADLRHGNAWFRPQLHVTDVQRPAIHR